MAQPHDLNALASNALKDIERSQAQQLAMQRRTKPRRNWTMVAAVLVAVLALYSASDRSMLVFWLGVSDQQQLAEMTAALTAANAAVDKAHGTTGEWPNRVPLPALAALVELQNPGPEYRLVARTEHWQLTMNPSGALHKAQP